MLYADNQLIANFLNVQVCFLIKNMNIKLHW